MHTLRSGMSGYAVEALQDMLILLGYRKGSITGFYDQETRDAVIAFQQAVRLEPTGIADERTQIMIAGKSAVVR